jgi:hypothetical protein
MKNQNHATRFMRYAQETTVPVDRSKAEIERLVQRYGATEFAHGWRSERAVVQFKMRDRYVRFILPLPKLGDFTKTATGRQRKAGTGAVTSAWEQACRQRWRALALSIKAKLESVESGIEEFEVAFMGQVVMPDGRTVSEHVLPAIDAAYKSGKMPELLLTY